MIPFHKPDIQEEDIEAMADAVRSGWLTHGKVTQEFEKTVAKYSGAKRGVALSSATAGLFLGLKALGVKKHDEVITTPLTFAATAHVIQHLGAKPVFVDIDPVTLNISTDAAGHRFNTNTKAIMPVDYAGRPYDLDLLDMAMSFGVPVLQDAAHSFGAATNDRPVGSYSSMTVFSFYATKVITTGEGGMLVTDNEEWADRVELLRLHGISRQAHNRYQGGPWTYEVLEAGYKANLTDFQSAMGLSQLKRDAANRVRRSYIAEFYTNALADIPGIVTPAPAEENVDHAWHLYPLRVSPNRSAFVQRLDELEIATSMHFPVLHLQPHFVTEYGYQPGTFPVAEQVAEELVSLPIWPGMTTAEVEEVVEGVRDAAGYL